MSRLFKKIKHSFFNDLPIIKLYSALYLVGVFVGVAAAVLLREQFSEQTRLLFSSEGGCTFGLAFLQQLVTFTLLFLLGLTAVGIPLLPLYPLYKGFSLGILISLAIIFCGVYGFFIGFPAFFIHNTLYTFLGYFVCISSARLSVSIMQLIRGFGKHSAIYQELIHHVFCFLFILPFLLIGAFWEWKIVPLILHLF